MTSERQKEIDRAKSKRWYHRHKNDPGFRARMSEKQRRCVLRRTPRQKARFRKYFAAWQRKQRLSLADTYIRQILSQTNPGVPKSLWSRDEIESMRLLLRLKRKAGMAGGAHKTPLKLRLKMRALMRERCRNQKTETQRKSDETTQTRPRKLRLPENQVALRRPQGALAELRALVRASRKP